MFVFQVNNSKIVLRRTEDDPEELTANVLLQKLNEMSFFQKLLKTQVIKKKQFTLVNGQCPVLTIYTDKKKKDKKKKRKNDDSDVNSEAVR